MSATSRGAGEVIAAAIDAGCRRVVPGIGGSASTDGGAGLLAGLGARLFDADGRPVGEAEPGCEGRLGRPDAGARRLAGVEVTVACDVDNPLTGPTGAAAVYGPQKGAAADQVRELLDAALAHFADRVAAATGPDLRDHPGAGAAGGVGFAALAVLGARLDPASTWCSTWSTSTRLDGVDLVVTGEGALDEQTLHGKAPAGVAAAARAAGVPVVAVCGRNILTTTGCRRPASPLRTP